MRPDAASSLAWIVTLFYPIGILLVLYAHNKPETLRLGLAFYTMVVALVCTAFLVQAGIDDPWALVPRIPAGSSWNMLACSLRSTLGDVAILTLVVHVWHDRLGHSLWSLVVFLPAMLWCAAVGVLPWLAAPSVRNFALSGRQPKIKR